MKIRPEMIIVTSNHRIQSLYPMEEDYKPLQRRFIECYIKDKSISGLRAYDAGDEILLQQILNKTSLAKD